MATKTNIKQRFVRMGQAAKRNMGLSEKTQVLSNDLIEVEKRVESIGHACKKTSARLKDCLLGQGQDAEKRTRKLPYSVLGQSMQDSSQELGENSIFGLALGRTAEACSSIALELTSHEMGVENLVLAPFNSALESDIPSIEKQKRKLKTLTLDMEAAKSSFTTAQRATAGARNLQEHSQKVDQLREQYDLSQKKVEDCKEALATEMMTLVAKEGDFARNLLDMVEAQAQYHRNALVRLEGLVPKMKELIDQDPTRPVYGIPLEEHLKIRECEIAEPIQMCIFWLMELGLEEEGLFRIAGTTTKVKMIKAAFDSNVELDMSDLYGSVHAVAGTLKQYLRDLPEPLLTFDHYDEFIQAGSIKDNDQKLQALWTAVNKLPKPNYNNFRFLIRFLDRVVKRSDVNKMTAANLSIVFAPNLLWSKEEGGVSVLSTGIASAIVELFIAYAEWFFPGDVDFDPPEVIAKSNSFSDSTSSTSDQTNGVNSPVQPVTPTPEKTPERPPERPPMQPISPAAQSPSPASSPSQAAIKLAMELSQSKPPAKPPPPGQQDNTPPAIPDRATKRLRRLSSFSKQQEELRKLLASVKLSDTIRSLSATEKEMAKRLGFLNVPVNKLKSASLPRRSMKTRQAPPIPAGSSPPTNLKRRSADSGINNSNDGLNSIDSSSSTTSSTSSTSHKAERPTERPPVPLKNSSLGRDAKLPTSPVSPGVEAPVSPVSPPAHPPKPPKSVGPKKPPVLSSRPTISPPPPPPKTEGVDSNPESCDTAM